MRLLFATALAAMLLTCGCVSYWTHAERVAPGTTRAGYDFDMGQWEEARDGFPFELKEAGGDAARELKLHAREEVARSEAENEWKRAEEREALKKEILAKRGLLQKIPVIGALVPGRKEEAFKAGGAGGDEAQAGSKRMIIYTAQYVLSVYDLEDSADRITQFAEEAGGYVSSQTEESVVIRVPADKFREVVEKLEIIGRVLHKELKAQDVTEQHTDLSLRLAAKKKYLETLQKLLEKAQDAKAMLEIQKEVGRVIEEIESLEGRLRYLSDKVGFSTISVRLNLATKKVYRSFRLPFGWIERLGIEHLIRPGGGAR